MHKNRSHWCWLLLCFCFHVEHTSVEICCMKCFNWVRCGNFLAKSLKCPKVWPTKTSIVFETVKSTLFKTLKSRVFQTQKSRVQNCYRCNGYSSKNISHTKCVILRLWMTVTKCITISCWFVLFEIQSNRRHAKIE